MTVSFEIQIYFSDLVFKSNQTIVWVISLSKYAVENSKKKYLFFL